MASPHYQFNMKTEPSVKDEEYNNNRMGQLYRKAGLVFHRFSLGSRFDQMARHIHLAYAF